MFRISNNLLGLLNITTLIISLPMIGAGVVFQAQAASDCERFLQLPIFFLGVFLLFVSLLGLVGAYCGASCLLWLYLFVMFALIIGITCFTAFAFVVTNRRAGEAVSNRGYREYRLGDYSHWLQRAVSKKGNWVKIQSCMKEAGACGVQLKTEYLMEAADFYKKNLSPIQSGCCKPPTSCGFTYENATYWTVPKSGPPAAAAGDGDCRAWSNDQGTLCYGCRSCKAGVLENIQTQWKKLAIFNVALLIILVVIYSIGCCAFRNNRADKYQRYRGGYR